jgi:glycosyltransferase involved in cell wall biosynthesis
VDWRLRIADCGLLIADLPIDVLSARRSNPQSEISNPNFEIRNLKSAIRNPHMSTAVIIPALDEEAGIALVLRDIPRGLVDEVIVVDNGSLDRTVEVARAMGATVLHEPERGYGAACALGIAHAFARGYDILAFVDADYSDHPDELPLLLAPIVRGEADLVIGSRLRGEREPGALPPHAAFGNWLSTSLIRLFWRERFTDLGPFRAITARALHALRMRDRTYGWTVEMQARAARIGLRCVEVPVSYRRRVGRSKVSGTIAGSFMAGVVILATIVRELFAPLPPTD